jgi:hypothetical protein
MATAIIALLGLIVVLLGWLLYVGVRIAENLDYNFDLENDDVE